MSLPAFARGLAVVALASVSLVACHANDPHANGTVTPVYDRTTGRLEQIVGTGLGSGRGETRAYVDGVAVKRVEIDRDGAGHPDRWEYYAQVPASADGRTGTKNVLVRAEEADRKNGAITRREFYDHGVIARVEEDADGDGRVDTWDYYEHGALVRVDLDLTGVGRPTKRLLYRAGGGLDHVEVDPTGSGTFHRADVTGDRGGSR